MYRYSHRLAWSQDENEFARLTQAQREIVPLLDLTSSNPTACFRDYPHTAIGEAFGNIASFAYEPEPKGLASARRAIAGYYQARHLQVEEARILLAASTSEAYAMLFKLFCDPGDEVLIPAPSYPLFEYLAALEGVRTVPYHLRYDGAWFLDFDHIEEQITPRTKAIVVVNPNNPTGTFLTTIERDRLLEIAGKHRVAVISDEVFMDYGVQARRNVATTFTGSDQSLSFSLNGLSKVAGMPQLKLAWTVVNGPAADRTLAMDRLELVSDTYLSVSTPVQLALPQLLAIAQTFQEPIQQRLSANLDLIDTSLRGTPAHRLHMDGGWSAILQLPRTRRDDEWSKLLLGSYGVVSQPGYYFDLPVPACLVLSLLTPPEILREGLAQIVAAIQA